MRSGKFVEDMLDQDKISDYARCWIGWYDAWRETVRLIQCLRSPEEVAFSLGQRIQPAVSGGVRQKRR